MIYKWKVLLLPGNNQHAGSWDAQGAIVPAGTCQLGTAPRYADTITGSISTASAFVIRAER